MSDTDEPTADESAEQTSEAQPGQSPGPQASVFTGVENWVLSSAPTPEDDNYWLMHNYEPTDDEREKWAQIGLPPDEHIVAAFLTGTKLIHGVPDKAEIFRRAELTKEDTPFGGFDYSLDRYLLLRIVEPTPLPFAVFTLASPPIGVELGDIVEHNYNVRLQVISKQMALTRIRVIHGSASDDSKEIVFEGDEYPGPAMHQRLRVIRVTVNKHGWATYEVVADTKFPRSILDALRPDPWKEAQKPNLPLDTTIRKLDIRGRTRTLLAIRKLETIEDVLEFGKRHDFSEISGFGPGLLANLKEKLTEAGYDVEDFSFRR